MLPRRTVDDFGDDHFIHDQVMPRRVLSCQLRVITPFYFNAVDDAYLG